MEKKIINYLQHKEELLCFTQKKKEYIWRELQRLQSDCGKNDIIGSAIGGSSEGISSGIGGYASDLSKVLLDCNATLEQRKESYEDYLLETIKEEIDIIETWKFFTQLEMQEYQILNALYIENQTWEAIAYDFKLSIRTIGRIRAKAIKKIVEKLEKFHRESTVLI
ncbi:MAG: hypothetical protein RR869_10515 [Lachnospiraceae bacterium]